MRLRSVAWITFVVCSVSFAGCDKAEVPEEPKAPVVERPKPVPEPEPAPPRDYWREQLFEPAQVERAQPKDGITWHESLDAATDEAAKDPRPIFVLVRCPLSEASGPDDDAILAGDGPLAELLTQCITVNLGDASAIDMQRLNFMAHQDPDQTWWCWLLSPDWKLLSVFGPSGRPEFPVSQSDAVAKWLTGALDYYYDTRRGDWRQNVSSPELLSWIPIPVDSSPKFAAWKEKATELERLRPQSNCLCCHQLQDALWSIQPRMDRLVEWWIWPDESVLGIAFGPNEPLVIETVAENSVAEKAGLKPGDLMAGILHSMNFGNWRLFSNTDFRSALHNLPWDDGQIKLMVKRGEQMMEVPVLLSNPQWRRYDLTWRKSLLESVMASHPGFLPTQADSAARTKLGLPESTGMAIIPQIGPASPNFKRGLLPEHVILQLGYVQDNLSDEKFLAMFNILVPPGGQVPIEAVSSRTGKRERIVIRGLSIFDIPRDVRPK